MQSVLEYGGDDNNHNENDNDNDDDDEKQTDWIELAKLKNKATYLCKNLDNDKEYKLKVRCRNQYGWSRYSNVISFKTS